MSIFVIKVIDNYRIAINKGLRDGIAYGDKFLIYKKGEELFDPITNESLGCLEIIKGRGQVSHLQEKICTLETYEKERRTRRRPMGLLSSAIYGDYEHEDVQVTFDNPELGDIADKID